MTSIGTSGGPPRGTSSGPSRATSSGISTFEAATRQSQGARSYQEDAAAILPIEAPPPASVAVIPAALETATERDERPLSSPAAPGAQTPPADPARLVTVLADGMGGHVGGSLASGIVCDQFLRGFTSAVGPARERLRSGLHAANRAIDLKVQDNTALSGMGSTLIGAVFSPDGMEWVSVGDSPLYLVRRGEIALINEDHSLAPALDQLAADGKITAEEARTDPRRHMLRSAITGDDLDLVDLSVKPLALLPGDYVILASDGIHSLDTSEIVRLVQAYAPDGAEAIAYALIRAIDNLREPHQDNTTVVVVRPV